MPLRDYQQEVFEKTIQWMRVSTESCILELATGAGKSLLVSAIAHWVYEKTGKRVLCLAPSSELIKQNHEKFIDTGNPASIFSASISKSLKHDVVFGSPRTVLNSIEDLGDKFAALIIDEAHGITPTIKTIIEKLKGHNENLRVIGLTATPYRLGSGYIFKVDENDNPVSESQTKNPYFHKLLCKVGARYLIEQGYLTPPVTIDDETLSYDATKLSQDKFGRFKTKEVEETFEGKGRLTAEIVADVVGHSQNRMGVMFFAATIEHAKEILASLPIGNSKLVTGETSKADRADIIIGFKSGAFKYLVNVSVLTTGFDAPNCDTIAIMRATESVGLLQQIIGRGLRLHDQKDDCLVLDYAGNIKRHCPDGDIFNPAIKAIHQKEGSAEIEVDCPSCGANNFFTPRKNDEEFSISDHGYFVDLSGKPIEFDGQPFPAHYGRRCGGYNLIKGIAQRCEYRWSCKQCPDCEHKNDIAARFCELCGFEIIDPNEKLQLEAARIKADPYQATYDKVLSWKPQEWVSKSGNKTLRIDWVTECRSFSAWYMPSQERLWKNLCEAAYGVGRIAPDPKMFVEALRFAKMPVHIKSAKDNSSGFYRVYGHNGIIN